MKKLNVCDICGKKVDTRRAWACINGNHRVKDENTIVEVQFVCYECWNKAFKRREKRDVIKA